MKIDFSAEVAWVKGLWVRSKAEAPGVLVEVEAEVVKVINTIKLEVIQMNWLSLLANIFKLTPYIVAGVQALHPTDSGATKKSIALNLLNISTGAAAQVLNPQDSAIAQAVSTSVSSIIDATVQTNKAAGVAGFSPAAVNQAEPAAVLVAAK